MLQLENATPFSVAAAIFPDRQGIDTLYVAVKATYTLGEPPRLADKQVPVVMADEYHGEPGRSSLKIAGEMHPTKPSTDVLLVGQAQGPGRRRVDRLDVTLAVADRRTTVRVFGDREWTGNLIPPCHTQPAPFETMPLVYERAFGGTHVVESERGGVTSEERNPVGRGFVGERARKELRGLPLPNLEDPARLLKEPGDRPAPVCFAPIAPSWMPRRSFAGTYDEAWMKGRAPYLPADFDPRFLNVAHPALTFDRYLRGGEPVEVINASPGGPLRINLPGREAEAVVAVGGEEEPLPLDLETVLLEPEAARLCLLWRGSRSCDKAALRIESIRLRMKGRGDTEGEE